MLIKHGSLELTEEEKQLILSGSVAKVAEEAKSDSTVDELFSVVDNIRTTKVNPDGCK